MLSSRPVRCCANAATACTWIAKTNACSTRTRITFSRNCRLYMSNLIAGVDEAGRGPLAGPVVVAAVILDPMRRINGLADSKVLAPERREVLATRIRERAIAFSVVAIDVCDIDRINIFHATMKAIA